MQVNGKQEVVRAQSLAPDGPWIAEGDGKWCRPLAFLDAGRGWVELMRLAPGTRLGLHRHTGEVHAYNLLGQRRLASGEVVGPGDYVNEQAGNVDWWEAAGNEPLVVFVVVMGSVEYIDHRGQVLRRITTADRRADYLQHCRLTGAAPTVPGAVAAAQREHRIRIDDGSDGASLCVIERGPAQGRPLLFLHGGAGSRDDWAPFGTAFDEFRCLLLDSRGHGASTLGAAGTLGYARLAADAERVIDELGLQAPLLIGHSDGGITALHVAARGRVRVGGVATISSRAEPPPPELLRNVYQPLTAARWRERFPDVVAGYERLNPQPDFDRLFTALKTMWCDESEGNYPRQQVRKIRCPALVIGGDADHLVPRRQTVALADAIDGAALDVVAYGSHVPHWDEPGRVLPVLRRWIEKTSKLPD